MGRAVWAAHLSMCVKRHVLADRLSSCSWADSSWAIWPCGWLPPQTRIRAHWGLRKSWLPAPRQMWRGSGAPTPSRPPCQGGLTVPRGGGKKRCIGGQLALQVLPLPVSPSSLCCPPALSPEAGPSGSWMAPCAWLVAQQPSHTVTVPFSRLLRNPFTSVHLRPTVTNDRSAPLLS